MTEREDYIISNYKGCKDCRNQVLIIADLLGDRAHYKDEVINTLRKYGYFRHIVRDKDVMFEKYNIIKSIKAGKSIATIAKELGANTNDFLAMMFNIGLAQDGKEIKIPQGEDIIKLTHIRKAEVVKKIENYVKEKHNTKPEIEKTEQTTECVEVIPFTESESESFADKNLSIEEAEECGLPFIAVIDADKDDIKVNVDINDPVNHPSHYCQGNYECIDIMLETQGIEITLGFCLGNAFKYLFRHSKKNGEQDIKKAKWYIDKYIEISESDSNKIKF